MPAKQPTTGWSQPRQQLGASLIEFVLVLPFLLGMLFFTLDYTRVMYEGITIANASRVGAGYGAQTLNTAVDDAGIRNLALSDAVNLTTNSFDPTGDSISTEIERFCLCHGDLKLPLTLRVNPRSCVENMCGGKIAFYVKVTTKREFRTVLPVWLLAKLAKTDLSSTTTIRVK
jgi:Flp pilus assembly protein TadG